MSALGTRDILRKDYKEYRMGRFLYGMSSALLPLADWIRKDPRIEASFADYRRSRSLDLLVVMSAYTVPAFTRELALHTIDGDLRARLTGFMNGEGVGLSPLPGVDPGAFADTAFYAQAELSQSRKKLQPLLSGVLAGC